MKKDLTNIALIKIIAISLLFVSKALYPDSDVLKLFEFMLDVILSL